MERRFTSSRRRPCGCCAPRMRRRPDPLLEGAARARAAAGSQRRGPVGGTRPPTICEGPSASPARRATPFFVQRPEAVSASEHPLSNSHSRLGQARGPSNPAPRATPPPLSAAASRLSPASPLFFRRPSSLCVPRAPPTGPAAFCAPRRLCLLARHGYGVMSHVGATPLLPPSSSWPACHVHQQTPRSLPLQGKTDRAITHTPLLTHQTSTPPAQRAWNPRQAGRKRQPEPAGDGPRFEPPPPPPRGVPKPQGP